MTEALKEKTKKLPTEKTAFATMDQFNQLTDVLQVLADSINDIKTKIATPAEKKEVKEVENAGPFSAPMNPLWEDKAREIIGEAVDHCEVFYPKGGGTIFTIVIKSEFSNASKSYMEMYKIDRRTREVGSEGLAGVETLAKLVKQNLGKPR